MIALFQIDRDGAREVVTDLSERVQPLLAWDRRLFVLGREIHARATVITTLDNVDILVPNGQFITEPVINSTFESRQVRVQIGVGVAYGSDTERVRSTLERVAAENPQVLQSPAPWVRFDEFGESSLDFTLLVWIAEPFTEPRISSDLRFAIDAAFREAEIEIPFPQRDLHLRSGWPAGAAGA